MIRVFEVQFNPSERIVEVLKLKVERHCPSVILVEPTSNDGVHQRQRKEHLLPFAFMIGGEIVELSVGF